MNEPTKPHGNTKEPKERRVRLAGGPFVKPETKRAILKISQSNHCSIGEVIDLAILKGKYPLTKEEISYIANKSLSRK